MSSTRWEYSHYRCSVTLSGIIVRNCHWPHITRFRLIPVRAPTVLASDDTDTFLAAKVSQGYGASNLHLVDEPLQCCPVTAQTDWVWKLSACFAYQSFQHSSLLSPLQVISSLIKINVTRGNPSYKQEGGTARSAKISALTPGGRLFDLYRPDNLSLRPEHKKHCKAWRRWVSRRRKHFTFDYICGISMGFIHECCWMSLILQMDWCPLWGLNTKGLFRCW